MNTKFIIIGAQKSATTYLQKCLSDHPEIFMQSAENPFFENPIFNETNICDIHRLFDSPKENCVGFKRPNYLGKKEVPPRIEKYLPDAKLIVILRDPIERAISAYFYYMKTGFLPVKDINIGLKNIMCDNSFIEKYKRANEIIEFGLYHKYLSLYDYFYKNNQLLIIKHESIKKDPFSNIKKAYKFLNVNANYIPSTLNTTPKEGVYSIFRIKFMLKQNVKLFNYYADPSNNKIFDSLVDKYIYKIKKRIDDKILYKIFKTKKVDLNEKIINKLNNIYKMDVHELEKCYGLDLSEWDVS